VRGKKVALVTDSNVGDIVGVAAQAELVRGGLEVEGFTVEAGEASKSWTVAGELLEAFASVGLDRTDAIVALGGGVIGDLAGFCAAVYLRGIDFVQVPTTLLAQVDASIGGKTAVDLRAGKNLAGAFKQPKVVLADTEVLDGLPDGEWRSGLAEVAKGAIIDSEEFLAWLEDNASALVKRDPDVVTQAVARAAAFKADVVAADERESKERECLNLGHTLGHAIEKVAGYGAIPHGVAVAEGMRFAARMAVEFAGAEEKFVARQFALLDALELPQLDLELDPAALVEAMRSDKKARGGRIRLVLPVSPGTWATLPVDEETLLEKVRDHFA
jgi:3-dehydroquinate synthase